MKPATLWVMFSLVVMLAAAGLAWISSHALHLHRHQQRTSVLQIQQQNLRVALWRLDSRLAPYIASLHQSQPLAAINGSADAFVESRFRLVAQTDPSADRAGYDVIDTSVPGDRPSSHDRQRRNRTLARAVAKLIPANDHHSALQHRQSTAEPAPVGLSKSQSYSNSAQSALPSPGRKRQSRADVLQQQVAVANTLSGAGEGSSAVPPREFQMISLWVDDRLAVVRTPLEIGYGLIGAWIDWPALHRSLIADIDDILPGAMIRPLGELEVVDPEHTLASLPAVIEPNTLPPPQWEWSPTHTALLLSWIAFFSSAAMAAFALRRLISLSERRASFVSAVTHELRTPLTTFRLYSDLLSRDLVTDPDERKSYLRTLRREADRLTHLVDNVLRYSRLERSSQPTVLESVDVESWIERIQPRLTERLAEAGMELVTQQSGHGVWRTDPPAMEQVVFNLVDNAAKYAVDATDRRVHLEVSVEREEVRLIVADHGPGIPPALQSTMFDPFSKSAQRAAETAAGVGLGLALVRQTVRTLGGRIDYRSSRAGGACFQLCLPRNT